MELYYTPPSDEIFDEVRFGAITIWNTYDDTYGYASEKIGRLAKMKNIEDNFMYIVAMFDSVNQTKLANIISPEARKAIRERLEV